MYFSYLDLPPLPVDIESFLLDSYSTSKYDDLAVDNSKTETTFASQNYIFDKEFMPRQMIKEIESIYEPIFKRRLGTLLVVTDAVEGYLSRFPPHSDVGRRIAINYIIQAGGSSVRTVFYDQVRDAQDLSSISNPRIYRQENLNPKHSEIISERRWHTHNVQRAHSVEDLESRRIFLSIHIYGNPSMERFAKDYYHLFTD